MSDHTPVSAPINLDAVRKRVAMAEEDANARRYATAYIVLWQETAAMLEEIEQLRRLLDEAKGYFDLEIETSNRLLEENAALRSRISAMSERAELERDRERLNEAERLMRMNALHENGYGDFYVNNPIPTQLFASLREAIDAARSISVPIRKYIDAQHGESKELRTALTEAGDGTTRMNG